MWLVVFQEQAKKKKKKGSETSLHLGPSIQHSFSFD